MNNIKLLCDTNNINDLKKWDDDIFHWDFFENTFPDEIPSKNDLWYFSLCGAISHICNKCLRGYCNEIKTINFQLYEYPIKYGLGIQIEHFMIVNINNWEYIHEIYFDVDDIGCHIGINNSQSETLDIICKYIYNVSRETN